MPSYLGWNVVSIPTTPSAPASIEFFRNSSVAISISPFTGQQQIVDWNAEFTHAAVSWPPMTDATAAAWITFLDALKGQACVFQFGSAFAAAYPASIGSKYWRLKSNTRGWTINRDRMYAISFEIREAL
jgi:hypothetical protein